METNYQKLLDVQAKAEKIFADVAREDRDPKAEEREELKKLYDEGAQLNDKILETKAMNEMHDGIKSWTMGEQKSSNSLADKLFSNQSYREWYKSVAPSGYIPESRKGLNSPSIEVKDFGIFAKSLITGSGSTLAGAFIANDFTNIYETIGHAPNVVRNLVSIRQTNSDTVEFVRQTTQVSQAAVVTESGQTASFSGSDITAANGYKPEGIVAYEKVSSPVETIAVWIPATKQALSDAPQMRGLIDQELKSNLIDKLDAVIFDKIAADEGILTQSYSGSSLLTTTRKAVTKIMNTGLDIPTAWVFNPADWETFELLQDGDDRYYYGGPMNAGTPKLWGIPVIQSFNCDAGYAYLANWNKAVLWDRQQATVSISDQHSDFFIRNMVAVLAELRAAFAITRPNSFVKVDLTA